MTLPIRPLPITTAQALLTISGRIGTFPPLAQTVDDLRRHPGTAPDVTLLILTALQMNRVVENHALRRVALEWATPHRVRPSDYHLTVEGLVEQKVSRTYVCGTVRAVKPAGSPLRPGQRVTLQVFAADEKRFTAYHTWGGYLITAADAPVPAVRPPDMAVSQSWPDCCAHHNACRRSTPTARTRPARQCEGHWTTRSQNEARRTACPVPLFH